MPDEQKVMTLRLARDQADDLEAIADVEDRPIAAVVREAIATHIDARKGDAQFQKRLREKLERNKRILEKLKKR